MIIRIENVDSDRRTGHPKRPFLDIGDGNGGGSGGDRGQHLVLLNIDEGGARGADSAAGGGGGLSIGEGDAPEVSKSDQRGALLEVLDDPLCVLFAESRAGRDRLAHGLARGFVLNDGGAGLGAGGSDGDGNLVTGAEGDAGEVVGVVGVPLIPGCTRWKGKSDVRDNI